MLALTKLFQCTYWVQKDVPKTTAEVSVRPRKRKVKSQKDAISQLSETFENLQKAQEKRMQGWFDADQKREERFLEYQERQADMNRQHELRMMEILIRFQQPQSPYQNPWVHEPLLPSAYAVPGTESAHNTNLDG